jgi:hypothetical protein
MSDRPILSLKHTPSESSIDLLGKSIEILLLWDRSALPANESCSRAR